MPWLSSIFKQREAEALFVCLLFTLIDQHDHKHMVGEPKDSRDGNGRKTGL